MDGPSIGTPLRIYSNQATLTTAISDDVRDAVTIVGGVGAVTRSLKKVLSWVQFQTFKDHRGRNETNAPTLMITRR